MLALVAAQLKFQAGEGAVSKSKPVWVDVRSWNSPCNCDEDNWETIG